MNRYCTVRCQNTTELVDIRHRVRYCIVLYSIFVNLSFFVHYCTVPVVYRYRISLFRTVRTVINLLRRLLLASTVLYAVSTGTCAVARTQRNQSRIVPKFLPQACTEKTSRRSKQNDLACCSTHKISIKKQNKTQSIIPTSSKKG